MAWLMQTKPLERYAPKMESTPSGKDLHARRREYVDAHVDLYPYDNRDFLKQGVFLPEEYFSVSAKVASRHKSLPDIINLEGPGVSERLKNLIEMLEPGVHQFHEVPVFMRDNTPADQLYYAMVIGNMSDDQVMIYDSPIGISGIRRPDGGPKVNAPSMNSHRMIAIDRSRTKGWHLWYSWDIYRLKTISDELHDAMLREKIVGQDYIELIEI